MSLVRPAAVATEWSRTIRLEHQVDLRLTLGPLCRGRADPAMRFETGAGAGAVLRATRSPEGPVATRISVAAADGNATIQAWGPGSTWALDAFPGLVGADDDDSGFDAALDLVVADLHRRLPGLRIGRSQSVVEVLVPTVLEQKVVGKQARRSYAGLVRALGEPAPGPAVLGLVVPPAPSVWAATPSWLFHRHAVERKRADAIRVACSYAARLEETVGLSPVDAHRRLTALPGIGAWTAAEVARIALGDADAVSLGDYHLPNQVAWALAGEPRADDARMLALLEPWWGHRARVTRLIEAGGPHLPRYGPRMPLRDFSSQ